jgi:hypothetical protein
MSDGLFEKLEPPPGGVTRLRARLAEADRRGRERHVRWLALAASVIAVLAIAGAEGAQVEHQRAMHAVFGAEVLERAGLVRGSEAVVQPRGDAAATLASASDAVLFFRVESTGHGERSEAESNQQR